MTTTADTIMGIAETVAQDFANYGDATESYAALRTAVESLVAERDALRAALQALIDMDVAYKRGPVVRDAVERARAALRGQP